MKARARANANMALVKYWGKRNDALRLPMNGSISLTLDGLGAVTEVAFDQKLERDHLTIDGVPRVGRELERVERFLDEVRARAGVAERAKVDSKSEVPLAAGLASSAAGFAALAVAASAATGARFTERELSILARKGSGSACRSILGGLVEWRKGERADGEDSYAEELVPPEGWDLGMVIAVADAGEKDVGSTEGMERSTQAAGYRHWLATVGSDLSTARRAIRERDLRTLGIVAESSATKLHMVAASASPPIQYWNEVTVRVIGEVIRMREDGGPEGYFTVDAGPNVAVLARAKDLETIAARLRGVAGVAGVTAHRAGAGARVLEP